MRVFVTGVGVVCSLGLTAAETFARLVRGERGLSTIDVFDASEQRASLGAVVRGVDVPRGDDWCRATAFAARAAEEALAQAGVDPKLERVGLVVGATTAGLFEHELQVAALWAGEEPRVPHRHLRSHPLTSTTDALEATLGPFARERNVASACSSGATALALALDWLALDPSLDAVLAGGTDGLCRLTLSGFNALGAIDPAPCRPFDRARRGLNLGEGAGFLVLERAERVRARAAKPLAELAACVLGAEAHHITNPEPGGPSAARIIGAALARAGVAATELDYVNAHGTATPLNDSTESSALATVLGAELGRIPVSSSKGQIGHTLGAAGAIEAVISVLALSEKKLPPTVGLTDPDPACPLVHVPDVGRDVPEVRAVLSNSFGFGGMDAAVVVTEPERFAEPRWAPRDVVITAAALATGRGIERGDGSPEAAPPPTVPDAVLALDAAKARRFDRSAKLCVAVSAAALAEAGLATNGATTGIVFGSAFSAVDESAAFVQRIREKGPRLASPLEFPNLVPSSPIGNASVYLGLRGPALAVADLRTSAECAFATAVDLVAGGEAEAMVAGGLAVKSDVIDAVFHPLFDGELSPLPRVEGASAIVVESAAAAAARGARVLARVAFVASARAGGHVTLPAPPPGALVLAPVPDAVAARALVGTTWRDVPRTSVELLGGNHEASGGAALAAAVRRVDAGAPAALVVGVREGAVTYAVLVRP
jgi:3-oxoacyl-[acyl-carrier-protein] synthase II